MLNAGYEIERLLLFGQKKGLIKDLDVIVARNQLLDLFHLDAPFEGTVPDEELTYPTNCWKTYWILPQSKISLTTK